MIIAYVFSILDMAIYYLRKPLDWDNYQYPHREVWLIPLWFCCSCQLNYIIPICDICPETSPQARGRPGYHSSLGQGLMEQFFSLKLQQS